MNEELPPKQKERKSILRWNIDHPGIIPDNPNIDLKKWRLKVNGKVKKSVTLKWEEILELPAVESVSNFHCVEGWSVRNLRWYGIKFETIVKIVEPLKEAKFVFFTCADGYTTSLELEDLLEDHVLLAYKLNNKFLETSLGGPLRLIVPEKYAYKSAMWLKQINFMKEKELGFWEKRGYSHTADVWKNDRYDKH